MTDKQAKGISNKYYDYTQGVLLRALAQAKPFCPPQYQEDDLTVLSYADCLIIDQFSIKATVDEVKALTKALNVLADILVHGSLNAGSITSKLNKFVREVPVKRYFEICREFEPKSIFDFGYFTLFAPVFSTFYFPNEMCLGTDCNGEPVLQKLKCRFQCKSSVMFACGAVHLASQQKHEKLRATGIRIEDIKDLYELSTIAQASSIGSVKSVNISQVEIPYWFASADKVLNQLKVEENAPDFISRLIFSIFNGEDDYLLHRTQIIQDKIVHIGFEGDIMDQHVALDKFYIHEVHTGSIHQIAFEYEKEGCLVTGAFGIHSFFLTDSYPYTYEAIVIALWLRSQIDKDFSINHVSSLHINSDFSQIAIWYENPRSWRSYFSKDGKRREETKARSFSNQIVHIDPFIRKLASGHRASLDALKMAESYHINIPDGYTLVTEFDRHYGGAI